MSRDNPAGVSVRYHSGALSVLGVSGDMHLGPVMCL